MVATKPSSGESQESERNEYLERCPYDMSFRKVDLVLGVSGLVFLLIQKAITVLALICRQNPRHQGTKDFKMVLMMIMLRTLAVLVIARCVSGERSDTLLKLILLSSN